MSLVALQELAIFIAPKWMSALRSGLACMLLTTLAACGGGKDGKDQKPAPEVGFVVVQPAAVPIVTQLGGRTVAFESSEVRPQVTGLLRKRLFTEGGFVRVGEPLFEIDPSLYRAAVNQAAANVQSARASAEAASAKAERFRPLAAMEAVAQQDYVDALAAARQARAAVAQNQAALETARINLRFTTVPAPISGRIGRSLFTVGALVSASQAEPLATIQRLDPMNVDMQQSSAELVTLKNALAKGGAAAGGSAEVRLKLEDGSDYPLPGTVEFSEMTVNEATGTVTLRARFPNPSGLLLPGMFVQAVFEQALEQGAYLVPQPAVARDFGGAAFVYVVGPGNKAVRRDVKTARTHGSDWVVTSGLSPGDRVITQGTSGLKEGAPIRPVAAGKPQDVRKPAAGKQPKG